VPVSGRVTLNDKPVDGMMVYFTPVSDSTPGSGSSGFTDADGRFTLTSAQGRSGAYPGDYKVSIEPPLGGADDAARPVVRPPPAVPRIYRDPSRTPLRASVPPGGGTIDVILTKSGKEATTKATPR
jgi:hypothetical protein